MVNLDDLLKELKSNNEIEFEKLKKEFINDDEIPEELLDEDGGIDVLKLEDNGWSLEIMDKEEEFDESEITEISISVDDKQFTFESD
jgi:hypothetical protein